MKNEYKYEAIVPEKFTVGIDDKSAGFPSTKTADGKWTNLSVFEKHCGFKPNAQRDARKEITKLLTQKVQEIDNIPTAGFRLVKLCKRIYKSEIYRDIDCAVLKDPRGWDVQVNIENLNALLARNGMNLKDGVLDGIKLLYGWPTRSIGPFSLYVADESILKMQEATSKLLHAHDSIKYIKPSEFEVGKIYSAKHSKMGAGSRHSSMYMYLGIHAIYSDDCHFKAVMRKSYSDYESFVKDRNDISNPERHVFYCLNPTYPVSPKNHGILNNYPGAAPYYVASSLSKLFETVEDVDPSEFKLYNDSEKPATLENIKADMETSAYFNRIDFSKSTYDVAVEYDLLESLYGYVDGLDHKDIEDLLAFPFYRSTDGIFLRNCAFPSGFHISAYGDDGAPGKYVVRKAEKRNSWSYNYSFNDYAEYAFGAGKDAAKAAFKKLYEATKPVVTQYVFCNGNKVPAFQNMMLNKRTHYRDIPDSR